MPPAPVCYNSCRMRYSKGLVLYHGEPEYGSVLKLIAVLVPVSLAASSFYLFSTGEREGGLVLLGDTLLVSLIFWSVFPRSYQVYEDHLRIVLGGPLSVKVRFDNVASIASTRKMVFSVNFATRMTGSYVSIALKRGLAIAITPRDYDQFVENANRALSEWKQTQPAGKTA